MASVRNPKTTHYEFLGPPGAIFVSIALPATIYALYFTCSEASGGCTPSLRSLPFDFVRAVGDKNWWFSLFDTKAAIAYASWYAYTIAAWYFLPGKWIEGTELRTGGRIKYKINAFATLAVTLGLTASWIICFGPSSFTFIYDHWIGFCTAALINAFVQAMWLYYISTKNTDLRLLALGGNTGNIIYDWLNLFGGAVVYRTGTEPFNWLAGPHVFQRAQTRTDPLVPMQHQPACKQITYRNTLYPTDSMILVLIFQGFYVADSLYNEPALLTTMDITTDGLGFMLSVGHLAWVPFSYSLQARYLAFNHVELGPFWTCAIFMLHAFGYWVFRGGNNEKNDFRNGKNPKKLKSLQTERGTRLLISGWWGICQHPNYLGDWIMAVSYSLPTGFGTPITYFYCSYFLVLLVHRQMRDTEACSKKYGKDWKTYTEAVPWKIFPYIY